jgi:acyl-coenzyme A thioesterase PaaI-like protein
MSKLRSLISKAQNSTFSKWMLNLILSRAIPFNKPHHFKIVEIGEGETKILLPYRRSNLNHVKGIHACALATLCEYAVGMTLISIISEEAYRIILKNIRIEYHYQAKMDVIAHFILKSDFVNEKIISPLQNSDAVFVELEVLVYDKMKNHICTGLVNWQVKKWNKVKSV